MMLKKLLFVLLTTILFGTLAFGQSNPVDLKKKKQQLQREIDELQRNANKAASNKKLTIRQIADLNKKISLMQDKIEIINSEMRSLDLEIHKNSKTVNNLKGQLGQLKKEYASMIRFAQKNQNSYTKMMFIFASSDFHQAYMRMKYLQQFGNYRKKQAGFIQGKEKNLKYKIVILDKNLKEKSSLMKEQESEKTKLGQNKEVQDKALSKYSTQEKQYRQGILERRKKQTIIDGQIRAAILRDIAIAKKKAEEAARLELARRKAAEERARITQAKIRAAEIAKAKAANKPIPPAPKEIVKELPVAIPTVLTKLSSDFEKNRGSLPRPVAGRITEGFGKHTEGQAVYYNDGINLEPEENAAVHTVFDGTVKQVASPYGKYYVLISHGSYYTVYHNLKSVSVSVGEKVSTNQVIGVVGNEAGKPHLQFQIWKGIKAQNPAGWIR
ncbi:murein hydrolase activator EnvC family protein [Pedobacter sp. JCM 36344]|uniref:murein hydrolase activator EnvC family protein n=1 Tax=Pedobacter sp. JCM 36344 TaxID=3374280 RepID=UPI00397AD9A8